MSKTAKTANNFEGTPERAETGCAGGFHVRHSRHLPYRPMAAKLVHGPHSTLWSVMVGSGGKSICPGLPGS
jgi:hypothetical protein